jgi:hypothetical protein
MCWTESARKIDPRNADKTAMSVPPKSRLRRAVVKVGDGRGFMVEVNHPNLKLREPVIITAAHCLPHFPPAWTCRGSHLSVDQDEQLVVGGMSGSPIVSPDGRAIGVISSRWHNPVIKESLPARFLRRRKTEMTNISTMMERRAALTAEIDAIPTDLTNEQEFKDAFDRKWAVEQTILSCKALTLADRNAQIKILAARAGDGADVADDLARLL